MTYTRSRRPCMTSLSGSDSIVPIRHSSRRGPRGRRPAVHELRRLALRPQCECCPTRGVKAAVTLQHEPGEELQLDWLELSNTPWRAMRRCWLVRCLIPAGCAPASPGSVVPAPDQD